MTRAKSKVEPIIEKPLPSSLDAEKSILGAILMDGRALVDVAGAFDPNAFFFPNHKAIYSAMCLLSTKGTSIDYVTVTELMHRNGDLEGTGAAYISSLTDGMPRVTNVRHYADIVMELKSRRDVAHACEDLRLRAMEGEEDGKALAESAVSKFLELLSGDGVGSLPHTWASAAQGAYNEAAMAIENPSGVMRLMFGVDPLDQMLGGLRREVILLVGMTSHGKSLLAMQAAMNGDAAGYKGLVFSAEMTKEALATRELAHTSGVPLFYLRRPEAIIDKKGVLKKLHDAATHESKRNILVVDQDITPRRIWSLCELVKKSQGLDFVIVDYDQLVIRAGLKKAKDDEFRAQAEFMAEALAIQKRLNIAFILLCQPRKVDDDVARGRKPPRIEQIFGHSAAGNTAHLVLWVMREYFLRGHDAKYERKAKAHVLKTRNDRTGVCYFGFDPEQVLFTSESWDPYAEVQANAEAATEDSQATKRRNAKKGREDA